MSDLWQRLKQRKLVQWAVAYVAFAFALLQGVDIVAQRFAWPDAIARGLIIASCVGFFVVLLLAWYHGERGAQKISGTELVLLALVLAIGGGLLWKFSGSAASREAVVTAASAPGNASSAGVPAADSIDDKSIAVLPFTSMSAGQDNAYFADGLSEEIINSLSRVPDLQVAARTSSFALRDSKDTVPDIAAKLRVATVLEGSVRRGGDKLRISAQLIRAADGYELWSETYDRGSKDVIAIQEDVARQIALALKTATDPKALAAMQRAGTRSVPAYDAYLRGLALRNQAAISGDYDYYQKALVAFDMATKLDPGFSDAYGQSVSIAGSYADPTNFNPSEAVETPYAQILDALRRRLDLASQHAKDTAQADYYRALRASIDLRFAETLRLVRRFLTAYPNDYDALDLAGRTAYILGDRALFRDYSERMFALSNNPSATSVGMLNIMRLSDLPRAVAMARESIKRFPDSADTAYQAQRILLTAGETREAASLVAIVVSSDLPDDSKGLVQMRQACAEGRVADAEALFESKLKVSSDPLLPWHGLLLLGRDDEAAKVLSVYDHQDTLFALSYFLSYPKFDVRRFPRLLRVLQAQGITPPPFRPEPYNCPARDAPR